MSEKTSEEKLREELEGNSLTGDSSRSSSSLSESKSKSSRLRGVRRRVSSGTEKGIGQRIDSFMDDFEKRIEESLGGGNVKAHASSSRQDKPRVSRKAQTQKPEVRAEVKPEAPVNIPLSFNEPDKPHDMNHEEQTAIVPDTHENEKAEEHLHEDTEQPLMPDVVHDAEQVSGHEDISPVESMNDIPQVIPESEHAEHENESLIDEPEDVHEDLNIEDEPEPEETEQHEHELPEIPLIDSEDEQENELPEIPVISADDVEEPDSEEEFEEFEDIPVIDAEIEDESESESDDNMPEVITENEESESEPEENDSDMAASESEDVNEDVNEETHEEFSPSADIVVNVDEDLPQITDEPEPEPDPEAEAVPVSVTMPETTKTAEDKLMADIAEAMTGNPLTLESKESPEPYRLPENFFQSQNSEGNSEQSAEDKLKANIAQAMSESPLGIAQQQAMQDLEQDLNPFDDISSLSELAERTSQSINESESESAPELELESESEREQEEENEDNAENEENEEAFLPDFTDELHDITTDPEDINFLPQSENEADSEDDDSSPFDIDVNTNDEPEESEMNLDELPLGDNAGDDVNDDIPDEEPLVESDAELEVEDVPLPESESEPGPESEPMTAQQRLEQEIAQFTQDAPEESVNDNDKDTQHEEVVLEKKMPESLLDEHEQQADDEIGDDWDINSLGIVSEAASIPDDEPEPEIEPEPEPEFMHETEETHKEKTMGIREKLAARKNGSSQKDSSSSSTPKKASSSSSSGGGMLLPLLLFLLLIVGGLTLWQLYTLPDRLASVIAMSSESASGVFDSVSGIESKPSYDYAIEFILDQNIVERMSQRGRDGWQVVGSRRTQDTTNGQYGYEIIFMRRISGR